MTTIAHITTVHPLSDPRILRKECRALTRAGHQVYLVGPGRTEDEPIPIEEGVRIVKTLFARGRFARATLGSFRVWRELRRIRPQVVHGHDPELLPLLVVWRFVNRQSLVIYDAHESLVGQIEGKPYIPRLIRPLLKVLAWILVQTVTRQLDGVVAATRHIEAEIPARRKCLVQNFPWASSYPEVTQSAGYGSYFCYVGGVTLIRGVREMIQAMNQSKYGGTLVVVGPVDGDSRSIVDEALGPVDYRGVVDSSQIPDVLSEASCGFVLFHPIENHYHAQPTKLFEYMAAGVPFIASDFPFWRELLGRFNAGYFVDPLDVKQIANVIDIIASDRSAAREMGARGRGAFKEHFSFDSQAGSLTTFVESLVGARGVPED